MLVNYCGQPAGSSEIRPVQNQPESSVFDKIHGHFPFNQRSIWNASHRGMISYLPNLIIPPKHSITPDYQRSLGHGIYFSVRTGKRGLQKGAAGKTSGIADRGDMHVNTVSTPHKRRKVG